MHTYKKQKQVNDGHFLTARPKWLNARHQCFGGRKTTIKEIITANDWINIIEFIRDSGRFVKRKLNK